MVLVCLLGGGGGVGRGGADVPVADRSPAQVLARPHQPADGGHMRSRGVKLTPPSAESSTPVPVTTSTRSEPSVAARAPTA